jgi:hypothetical protein
VIISLSVVNAIASSATTSEILLTDFIVTVAIWVCEKRLRIEHSKLVQYDRIELIKPERREDLIADLENRLGLDVINVEVGAVDMLRDMAIVKVYYKGNSQKETISIDSKLKLSKEDLKTV